MEDAWIFDAPRTPRGRGKPDGALHEISPVRLVTGLLQALPARGGLEPAAVDDVVLGCVTATGEQGADIARAAVLYAGWPESVPAVTLNRFCASGLEAVNLAAMKVRSGEERLVVAGGVESMSRCPLGTDGGAWLTDPQVNHATAFVPQGVSADLIATLEDFDRPTLDAFGVESHRRAARAAEDGAFARSLVPVRDVNGLVVLDRDETIRPDANLEDTAALAPSFAGMGQSGYDDQCLAKYPGIERVEHVHHAGTSSAIVDGAALVVIGSAEGGRALGLEPRARVRATAVIGSESTIMLTGPVPAARRVLERAGMTVADIDLWEINEAFAVVPLYVQRELGLDPERVNVNGGAIGLGHPVGATGAILVGTLIDELERRDLSTGLACLCAGGGMGIATIVERP